MGLQFRVCVLGDSYEAVSFLKRVLGLLSFGLVVQGFLALGFGSRPDVDCFVWLLRQLAPIPHRPSMTESIANR